MEKVIMYTDGACSGNPGPGGWGTILEFEDGSIIEKSGAEQNTTNNKMELCAVIKGFEQIRKPSVVEVYSDSAYVINAFMQNWINNWILNGWKNAEKKPVKNSELWRSLIDYTHVHKVTWHKVKGHADNEKNNRCDFLATSAIKKLNSDI